MLRVSQLLQAVTSDAAAAGLDKVPLLCAAVDDATVDDAALHLVQAAARAEHATL
jgi:hypothetical protein